MLSNTEQLLMEQQGKTMDRTSQYAITLIVTGQEGDKDREEEVKDGWICYPK